MEKPLKQTVFIPVPEEAKLPHWNCIPLSTTDGDFQYYEKREDVFVLTKSQLEDFAKAMRKYTIDHAEYVPQAGNSVWITGSVEDFMDEQLLNKK